MLFTHTHIQTIEMDRNWLVYHIIENGGMRNKIAVDVEKNKKPEDENLK